MSIDTSTKKQSILQNHQPLSRRSRVKETVVINLLGEIPRPLGTVLRRLAYRTILAQMGSDVYIQKGVELLGANRMEFGNKVKLLRYVHLDARAQNSKIRLEDGVCLGIGVHVIGIDPYEGNCQIEIGEGTSIGLYSCISGPGQIKIGKRCLIASHVGIYANNHIFADPTRYICEQGITRKGIVIEDDCWLGSGVKVLDGVTIGQGSVIGAGAVVTKDIPPYSVAVGIPARAIASRNSIQPVNHKQAQSHIYQGNSRRVALSTALTELEKTAKLNNQEQVGKSNLSLQLVFENLLHALLECIHQLMDVDTVTVLLRAEDGQQLAVCATLGLEEEIATGVRIPLGRGFAGKIAAQCEMMIVEDLSQIEVVSPILRHKGLRSMLGVPILANDEVIGVFHVGTFNNRQFTRKEAQTLQSVAERMALAIEPLAQLWQSPNLQSPNLNEQSNPHLSLHLDEIKLSSDNLLANRSFRALLLQFWRTTLDMKPLLPVFCNS